MTTSVRITYQLPDLADGERHQPMCTSCLRSSSEHAPTHLSLICFYSSFVVEVKAAEIVPAGMHSDGSLMGDPTDVS